MPDTPNSSPPLDSPVQNEAPGAFPPSADAVEGASSTPENLPASQENIAAIEHSATQESAANEMRPAPPALSTARMRGRRTLPASPVERAKLEAQEGTLRDSEGDRATMVAFGLLFIVPLLIIILSLLLLLPFISSQFAEDPSGVQVQTSTNGQPAMRQGDNR